MTEPKKRGGPRPNAGRPFSGKVKLTCWIKPETRAKLGAKPGEVIDRAFSKPNVQGEARADNAAPSHDQTL